MRPFRSLHSAMHTLISPLMVELGNCCKATSDAVSKSSTIYTSGPRFMSRPIRSPQVFVFRSGEFAVQERILYPVRLLNVRHTRPGVILLENHIDL
ncbi:hypothetical protein TNCV_2077281 [Trichonephila clavipes]|nr:hypothetical protein TNCV_2077281 [Trichonephila clavipes]